MAGVRAGAAVPVPRAVGRVAQVRLGEPAGDTTKVGRLVGGDGRDAVVGREVVVELGVRAPVPPPPLPSADAGRLGPAGVVAQRVPDQVDGQPATVPQRRRALLRRHHATGGPVGSVSIGAVTPIFDGVIAVLPALRSHDAGFEVDVEMTGPLVLNRPFHDDLAGTWITYSAVDDRGNAYLGALGDWSGSDDRLAGRPAGSSSPQRSTRPRPGSSSGSPGTAPEQSSPSHSNGRPHDRLVGPAAADRAAPRLRRTATPATVGIRHAARPGPRRPGRRADAHRARRRHQPMHPDPRRLGATHRRPHRAPTGQPRPARPAARSRGARANGPWPVRPWRRGREAGSRTRR